MAYTLWSQDIFSKGELSPYMYGRVTVNEYQNGLKTAQNVLTYPTGAAGKRFGTFFRTQLTTITTPFGFYFNTFQYLNECTYQIVIVPGSITIYLEGLLVATVTNTFVPNNIDTMSTTIMSGIFRMAANSMQPFDLTRAPNSGVALTATTSTTYSTATPYMTSTTVYPVQFVVAGGTGIQTVPQISQNVTYFAAALTSTTAALFPTSQAAYQYLLTGNIDTIITITGLGTGTTTAYLQNTWTLAATTFKNVPVYDFNGITTSYDNLTFTPSALTGTVTITISGGSYAPLNSSYINGAFIGGGGTSRITAVASTTSFTVSVQNPFDTMNAINGSLVFLAEPAWSTTRGWPQVCSSYQNRALFANTPSLQNGFYASVVNDYADFGDLTNDDDDAISWYPTSNNMNYIRFIVPYRSVTVHSNTGIYSSPLSDVSAITPSNFTLQLQDSTPATVLQPEAIDNQILVLSGNDAHQMLWDGINNAYTSDIVSIINEQTINNPVDETAFQDLTRAGSRFVFIINEDGSMAAFQTLLSQNVSGICPQIMEQSYGDASFLQAASSSDGRCWFVTQRQQTRQFVTPINITGFTSSTLTANGTNLSTTLPTPLQFLTTGTLPASTPQITTTQYSWGVGTDANHFIVFVTQEDAIDYINNPTLMNYVVFTSDGTESSVAAQPLVDAYYLEELTYQVNMDCAMYWSAPSGTTSVGVLPLFNAQFVNIIADGFGLTSEPENNINHTVPLSSHGLGTLYYEGYIGFPVITIMEPMPLSISLGGSAKTTNLTKPVHVRTARFMFTNTIGGYINDVPIALSTLEMSNIGEPPVPDTGIIELSIFKAWDDFNNPNFTIYHDNPFNITLLGVFYGVETS